MKSGEMVGLDAYVVVEWDAVSIQVFVGLAVAKWLGIPLPDWAVGFISDEPWGVDLIGIDTIDTFGFDDANGGVAQVDGFLEGGSLRIVFAKDTFTGPGIKRGFVCVGIGFFDALVVGVVQVVRFDGSQGAYDLYQSVSGIILIGVLAVINQVAVVVIVSWVVVYRY